MRSLSVIFIAGLLLVGCATLEQFQRDMDSRLGWDVAQLREYYGYNYIERDLGGGLRALTWTWTDHGMRPGHQTPDIVHTYQSAQGTQIVVVPGEYFPPEYYEYGCELSFIIGAEGRAVSWRAQGNGCVSYPGPGPVLRHGSGTDAKP